MVNITLMLLPLFSMGLWNDLVMGGGTALMFLLMMYIMDFLFNSEKTKPYYKARRILVVLLLAGAIYPLLELKEVINNDIITEKQEDLSLGYTMESYANRALDISLDLKYNYYSYDIQNNIFYKYIAAKKYE